jgi:hypothetical protein
MKPVRMKETEEAQIYKMDSRSQCPLVGRRYDECYCKNMTSQKIANVVHYCMRNFEACEIYKKKMAAKEADELDPESPTPAAIPRT